MGQTGTQLPKTSHQASSAPGRVGCKVGGDTTGMGITVTSYCASCGRQRDDTARFCAGCGTEFSDQPTGTSGQGDAAAPAAGAATQGSPADIMRAEAAPGVTRVEPPANETDPFASWYQRQAQADRDDAGSTWQPTETVNAGQGQGGYEPSGFTAGNPFSSANPVMPPAAPFPPPGPPTGPPAGGGRRGLFLVLAVVVVLAAGGGAYALATKLGKHSTGQPNASSSSPAAGSTGGSPTAGTGSPTAPASGSATPSPSLSLVAVSPAVSGSAAEPQVETLLSHYFEGINTHSYAEYSATLNPAEQAKQTQSQFNSGYSSTTDSGMTLTGLSDTGSGGLTATVTFTSRQSPSQSVDKSACNAWTLNLYLVPQTGGGYLIGPAPSGYQPTFSDC